MSDAPPEQDRSEEASPYKLAKSREKGIVARGMDLGFFASLTAVTGCLWIGGASIGRLLSAQETAALVAAPQLLASPGVMLKVIAREASAIAAPMALMALTVFAVVLVAELIQTGFVFSTEPLRPDFSRLNPAKGLKRLFSWRLLIETAKSILKVIVYTAIAFMVGLAVVKGAGAVPDAAHLAAAASAGAQKLLMFFVLAAAAFAVLDQIIVRQLFRNQMRMSRRELKREARDREGDPRLKQKRKQLHAQFAKLGQNLRGIRGADVLITNPTHFAVALKYDASKHDAPIVVSQGSHRVAERLKRLAFTYGVTIVPDPPLARFLVSRCRLGDPIPDEVFERVADILLEIRRKSSAPKSEAAHA